MAGDCLRMCPNVVLRAHIQANKAVFASNCAQSSVVGHTFRQSDEKWSKLFFRLFSLDIQRAALYFDEGTADIFAQDAQRHQSQTADEENKAQ